VCEGKEQFGKPALSVDRQISLLTSRGLIIEDEAKAKHYLSFIGYYRLSGYCLHFQNGGNGEIRHHFKSGTTFDSVLDLYIFDRKLRLMLIDIIERIEVAIRECISNTLSNHYDGHWFLNSDHFKSIPDHEKLLQYLRKEVKNSKELFIKHYHQKYCSPELPPSWMTFEILSLGTLSRIFKALNQENKKEVSKIFNLDSKIIESWLHSITYLRNLCAHHNRVWDRSFTIKPKQANLYKQYLLENDKFYAQAVVLEVFLKVIAKDSYWPTRLKSLLEENPSIPLSKMGFSEEWYRLPLWQVDSES
jgi:abortive infection bacteriophage resistance protein